MCLRYVQKYNYKNILMFWVDILDGQNDVTP